MTVDPLVAEFQKEAERATALAERYADAIEKVTEALNNEEWEPPLRILRARMAIVALLASGSGPVTEGGQEK